MATAIPDSTNLISIEETDFSSSVSEAVFQKMGGGVNYAINLATGFDSRLDVLEAPITWIKTNPTIYVGGGSPLSPQPTTSDFTYVVDRKRLIFTYVGLAAALNSWGDFYYIPMPAALTVNTAVLSYDTVALAYFIPNGTALGDFRDNGFSPQKRPFVHYDLSVNRIRGYFPIVDAGIGGSQGSARAVISGIIPLV